MVDIDQIFGHAECLEAFRLGDDVLLIDGDATPDEMRWPALGVTFGLREILLIEATPTFKGFDDVLEPPRI